MSSTSISESNTNIYINMNNAAAHAQPNSGLKLIPAGSPAAGLEQKFTASMLSAAETAWKANSAFTGTPFNPSNFVTEFLEVRGNLNINTPAPCAIDLFDTNLNNWGITAPAGFAENAVHTILLKLLANPGLLSVPYGHKVLGPVQTINWEVVVVAGQAGAGKKIVHFIGFGMTATQ
jgi:hypothetical protein